MRKPLKYLGIFFIVSLGIYAAGWAIVMFGLAKSLNDQFAGNKYLSAANLGFTDEYYIRIQKISPAGFPFKFAVKVIGWEEEGKSNQFEFKSPIIIGYDLLKQRFFASYSGEALGRYKPLNSGFGSSVQIKDYDVAIKMPLNYGVLKTLFLPNNNWFELVNYINGFQITSGKITISDLVDGRLLYELASQDAHLHFERQKRYTSSKDFFEHIPQRWDVISNNKITYSKFEGKQIIPTSIFYSFWRAFVLSGESKFYIKTGADKIKDVANDLEIGIDYARSSSNIHSADSKLFYQGKIQGDNADITLKASSDLSINSGFFDNMLELVDYFTSFLPNDLLGQIVVSEFDYIKSNRDRFPFKELENKKYKLDLDFALITRNESANLKINHLEVSSGKTAIMMEGNTELQHPFGWSTDGNIVINNYQKVIDLAVGGVYNVGKLKFTPEQVKSLHADVAKYFLASISDHPESNSPDLSFEYKLNSTDLRKGKVGSVEVIQLRPMYILALYKTAAARIQEDGDVIGIIKQMDPDIAQDDKIIEALENLQAVEPSKQQTKDVDPEVWKKLIK